MVGCRGEALRKCKKVEDQTTTNASETCARVTKNVKEHTSRHKEILSRTRETIACAKVRAVRCGVNISYKQTHVSSLYRASMLQESQLMIELVPLVLGCYRPHLLVPLPCLPTGNV